jgi:hypothetical protein
VEEPGRGAINIVMAPLEESQRRSARNKIDPTTARDRAVKRDLSDSARAA